MEKNIRLKARREKDSTIAKVVATIDSMPEKDQIRILSIVLGFFLETSSPKMFNEVTSMILEQGKRGEYERRYRRKM